jgi:type I restriction enzyme S subunit
MLGDVVDILDAKRVPVNATERAGRSGTVPYYGATGQVGWIDEPIFDEELVLLGEDGAPFLDASRPKAYFVTGRSWVNNHAHVLRGKVGAIDNRFLLHQLNAVNFRPYVGGTTRLKLPQGPMRQIPLVVPDLHVQRAVAGEIEKQLSRIDAGLAALKRVQANLKRYRASVLKAACEGRLVPTEAELARRESRDYEPASVLLQRILKERRLHWEASELAKLKAKGKAPTDDRWKSRYKEAEALETTKLPSLPEGWCWATTDMVGDILLGRQRAPQYLTGKWTRPYLRVANVKDDRVDLSDIETMDFDPVHFAQYRLLPGDILVSEGQSPELVGQSAIYQGGIDGLCFQKTLHRFRSMPHGPTPEFAQIVFRAHVKTGFFQKVASITTNIAHLTLEKFKASPFPLPPIAEQQRITAEVKRRTSLADHLQEALDANAARADRLRQSILASAFQGKLTGAPDRAGAEARNPANASARPSRSSLPDEAFANA